MSTAKSKDRSPQAWVLGLSFLTIGLGPFIAQMPSVAQFFLIIFIVASIGIPHGATDYLIFQKLAERDGILHRWTPFIQLYLGFMVAYGLVWSVSPALALVLFLVISAYHFGQSNWHDVRGQNGWSKLLLYLTWGAYVILLPMLLHWEQCRPILEALAGIETLQLPSNGPILLAILLLLGNLIYSLILYFQGQMEERRWLLELFSLAVLFVLFWRTPLLVGFTVYFGLWHSLGSLLDQYYHFKRIDPSIKWRKVFKMAFPYTLTALGGMSLFTLVPATWANDYLAVEGAIVFISLVTLPHMILIDHLYEEKVLLKE